MTIQVSNPRLNEKINCSASRPVERRLLALQIAKLADFPRGGVVICTSGLLWVTQEGDPVDYLLASGEKFTANRRGAVLVEALKGSACWQLVCPN